MHASIDEAFIHATQDVFATMVHLESDAGEPFAKQEVSTYDLSGIISFKGDLKGTAALTMSQTTAKRICSLFAGADRADSDRDIRDAIGELISMIAGSATAQLSDKKVQISCPAVIVGVQHSKKEAVCIPFESDCGTFTIELALKDLGDVFPVDATVPAAV